MNGQTQSSDTVVLCDAMQKSVGNDGQSPEYGRRTPDTTPMTAIERVAGSGILRANESYVTLGIAAGMQ